MPVKAGKTKPNTPATKTPTWRISGLAEEGDLSSPPPTDPHMKIASQAETIGSDDSEGAFAPQDTQAYRLDSDLVSFIAEDDENVEDEVHPTSSLPGLDLSGIGKGTQAVLQAAQPRRPKKAAKIFTSDISDDDQVVSSDSEDDAPIRPKNASTVKQRAFMVDSSSEDEVVEPPISKRRARRVIEDDDEDDE